MRLFGRLLIAAALFNSGIAQGATATVLVPIYGPQKFLSQKKTGPFETATFSAQPGVSTGRLQIVNGAGMDSIPKMCTASMGLIGVAKCLLGNLLLALKARNKASYVEVRLNDKVVLKDIKGLFDYYTDLPVTLKASNKLEVLAVGVKDSYITLQILGESINNSPIPRLVVSSSTGIFPHMVTFDASASSDPENDALSYAWNFGDGQVANGKIVTHEFLQPGSYTSIVTVTDSKGLSATAQTTILITRPVLPPDPKTIAPPIPTTASVSLFDQVSFLTQGPNPIQRNVQSEALDRKRPGLLRGKIVGENGVPISGVSVRVLEQPTIGDTLTRDDGYFDMAVNGGGALHSHFHVMDISPFNANLKCLRKKR